MKDFIQEQHRHITSHAIALRSDLHKYLPGCLTQCRAERIHLNCVGPRREVGISAVGKPAAIDAREGSWCPCGLPFALWMKNSG